ncbi:MAG: PAS domain S-box protein, partial [Methylococcaceae bacterium]|nr:PAS domain S-box protein [Methylococcaceae bacterium]
MLRRSRSGSRKLSFLSQLIISFSLAILCISLLSSIAISTLSYEIVRERWIAQGLKATETLADQMTLALLYFSQENAETPVRSILAFPDVRGVAIYGADRSSLLVRGVTPAAAQRWPDQLELEQETESDWVFMAPVFARRGPTAEPSPFSAAEAPRELIGFVRLTMSKNSLKAMERGILVTNLAVSGSVALIFLAVLIGLTRRLTTPLKTLASIMGRASAGEKQLLAEIRGPRDIVEMEQAFNTMMGVLEQRERQLERARDDALAAARTNALVNFALNHVREAALLIDRDALVHYANDEACRLLGRNLGELLHLNLLTIGSDTWPQPWLDGRDCGRPTRIVETVCRDHDGRTFPAEVTTSSFDYEGHGYVLALVRDISDRKRAEEEIRALNLDLERRVADRTAALEAANKELEAFAYSVSHDLRAPLRHIDGFISLFKRHSGDGLDEQSRHYLDTISGAAKRMAG